MSASSKKKLRKEQNAAHMTKKQQAAKKEAKKLMAYTVTFWTVLVLCVALVLGIVLEAPINRAIDQIGTAVKVGDHKVSTTELTYFYVDGINNWYSQYGSYAQYLNLNTSVGLDDQVYDEETGITWADYFLDQAIESAKNVYALCDAADKAGYSLSDEEQANVDALYDNLETQAKTQNLSVSKYLRTIYGDSANEKTYKEYYEATVLASAYYSHYAEQLKDSYKPEDLRAFEKDEPYKYNSYTYASYYLSLDTFKLGGTKDDDGKVTYTEAELAAAKAYLEEYKALLADAANSDIEKLNAAIAEMEDKWDAIKAEKEADKKDEDKTEDTTTEDTTTEDTTTEDTTTEDTTTEDKTEDTKDDEEDKDSSEDKDEEDKEEEKTHATATENKKQLYTKVSSVMQDWIRGKDAARKAGDITAIPYETTSTDADGKEVKELKGYYIVLFQEEHDNTKAHGMTDVRHLLVAFEGGTQNSTTGQTTYSDAEKKKAKDEADKLLKEWKDGAATEDSFAALANKHSDDGDGTTGGLYEDIYRGQMVTNFENWCFDEARKTGDTDIVETEYGYHIMYFVSGSEQNYRDYMITNDKLTEEMTAWQDGLLAAMTVEKKNLDRIDKDLVLNGGSASTESHEGHDH